MAKGKIPKGCLVVICTGAEAKVFRNIGESGTLRLKLDDRWKPESLLSDGPSGSFVPESSEQETDEATFSKQLAQRLYALSHAGKYQQLVLIADPDTLGEMRPLLHKEVSDKIILELNKTLIDSPIDEVEKIINAG